MEYNNEITRIEESPHIGSVSFKRKSTHHICFTPLSPSRPLPPLIKEEINNRKLDSPQKKSHFSSSQINFSKAFDDLILKLKCENKKDIEQEEEEDIESLTSSKDIKNFYEYTKMCLEKAKELPINDTHELSSMYIEIPEEREHKKIAIFDLDETLIHCEIKNYKEAEYIIDIKLPTNKKVKVGINIRPHCIESLKKIKSKYYLIAFTASTQAYADSVLNFIDPNNEIFSKRLYRHNCRHFKIENVDYYVKDLRILKNVSLEDVVIIDNSLLSFAFHLKNGIPIVPYYDGKNDSELIFLTQFLLNIAEERDLRDKIESHIKKIYDEI